VAQCHGLAPADTVPTVQPVKRPNFLLLTTDQHRADGLGCTGNPHVHTPNLDRLANSGVRVEQAFVNQPLCMPSRATLLTGRYPRSHGVWCNGVPLREDELLFSDVLAAAGYHTATIGKMHFKPFWGRKDESNYDLLANWRDRDMTGWHGPYFGFREVQIVHGHCDPRTGHWGLWLQERFPEVVEAYAEDARRGTPAPSGAPETWKSTLPVEAHHSTWIGEVTCEMLRREASAERPFLIWASFPDPHHPFRPPEPYAERYEGQPVPMPLRREGELDDKPPHFRLYHEGQMFHEGAGFGNPSSLTDEQMRDIIRYTYGMISLVDDNIGRILRTLDETGLAENTVVLFVSDHGELLGDHGLMTKGPFLYDGLIRVPMLWRWPGRWDARNVVEGLCGLVDVAPTLYELAGVPAPVGTQGTSLAPVLRGDAPRVRDWALVEFHSGYRPHLKLKALVTPEHKLVHYAGQPYGELYNRIRDPGEFENRYDDLNYRRVRRRLERQLLDALILTEDRRPARESHA
jgi:arylsulfatase